MSLPTPRWRGDEPCIQKPELFHPVGTDARRVSTAKWMCGLCLSKNPCLEWALSDRSLQGIHGGTTASMRKRIRERKNKR